MPTLRRERGAWRQRLGVILVVFVLVWHLSGEN